MRRQLTLMLIWSCLAAGTSLSRQATETPVNLALPAGNGAWVIRILTSGGFSGTGNGDTAVSSSGQIVCTPENACPKRFEVRSIQLLIDKIAEMAASPVTGNRAVIAPSACNDCLTRRVTVVWRDAMAVEHSYSVSWDEVTGAIVPPEVIQIYEAVTALRKVK